MKYTVLTQPDTSHNDTKIVKHKQVIRKTTITINGLLTDYASICRDIQVLRAEANCIVDELIGINKVYSVDDIPEKL